MSFIWSIISFLLCVVVGIALGYAYYYLRSVLRKPSTAVEVGVWVGGLIVLYIVLSILNAIDSDSSMNLAALFISGLWAVADIYGKKKN